MKVVSSAKHVSSTRQFATLTANKLDTILSSDEVDHLHRCTGNLASTINRVCEDNAPVVITRNRDQAVVMLSLSEYESLEETAHLLRSPENAKRLLRSIEQLERGKGVRKKLKLDV